MVFESSDGPFGSVATMAVWQDKLVVNSGVVKVVFQLSGGLVIHALKLRFETSVDELGVNVLVGAYHFGVGPVLKSFGEDCAGIKIIDNK